MYCTIVPGVSGDSAGNLLCSFSKCDNPISAVSAGYSGSVSSNVHCLSLSAVCLRLYGCRVWWDISLSLRWRVSVSSRRNWCAAVECSVSRFFFFERYLDIVQPLFHFFVLVWYGDASPIEFCSDLLSHLCFKKINENGVQLSVSGCSGFQFEFGEVFEQRVLPLSKVLKLVCCVYFEVGVFKGPFDVGEEIVVCAED